MLFDQRTDKRKCVFLAIEYYSDIKNNKIEIFLFYKDFKFYFKEYKSQQKEIIKSIKTK